MSQAAKSKKILPRALEFSLVKLGLNRVTESKDLGMSPNNLHKNRLVRDSCNDQTVIFYDAEARNQTLGDRLKRIMFICIKCYLVTGKCNTNCQHFNSRSASTDEPQVQTNL